MAQGELVMDLVHVAPALSATGEVALALELADDAVGGALGDADAVGDLTQPQVGVARDAQEHVRVVGEEVEAGDAVSVASPVLGGK